METAHACLRMAPVSPDVGGRARAGDCDPLRARTGMAPVCPEACGTRESSLALLTKNPFLFLGPGV